MTSAINILHQQDQNRFIAQLEGSSEFAVLTYQLRGNNTVNFNYSYVPPTFRGKGVAKQLVDCGFSWAQGVPLRISATCSYVAQFVPPDNA